MTIPTISTFTFIPSLVPEIFFFFATVFPKPRSLAIVTYCKVFSWYNTQYHAMSSFYLLQAFSDSVWIAFETPDHICE